MSTVCLFYVHLHGLPGFSAPRFLSHRELLSETTAKKPGFLLSGDSLPVEQRGLEDCSQQITRPALGRWVLQKQEAAALRRQPREVRETLERQRLHKGRGLSEPQ